MYRILTTETELSVITYIILLIRCLKRRVNAAHKSKACRVALLKKQKNLLKENFIEGMACTGGCIGGAGCLTHGPKDKGEVDKYGREAQAQTISAALDKFDLK